MNTTFTTRTELHATDKSPGEAIMAGFSLVAADNPALGATLRAAARKAADEFTGSIEAFPSGSRERQYLSELLMAAVSFSAGLARRQQERAQRIQAAEEERQFNFQRIVQTQRLDGIFKGGVQLLALGGLAYAMVSLIIDRGMFTGLDRQYASLATALASALIGSFCKAWWTGWRIDRIHDKYRNALRDAKLIYLAEAKQEYEFAAQEANLAWQKLTGRNPPVTDAFRVLIFSLLGDGECEREAEPEPVIATAVGSVEQPSLAVRG